MLPDKFLENNCIENLADINRVLHYFDSWYPETIRRLEEKVIRKYALFFNKYPFQEFHHFFNNVFAILYFNSAVSYNYKDG